MIVLRPGFLRVPGVRSGMGSSVTGAAFLLLTILLFPHNATAMDTLSRGTLDALLLENRGKVTLVSYWATWCSACRDEIPELKKIRENYSQEDLTLIGISLDTNGKQLTAFMKMAAFNYDIYQVPEEKLDEFKEIDSLPTLVFYKKNGKKGWTHRGYMSPEEIRKTIEIFSRVK